MVRYRKCLVIHPRLYTTSHTWEKSEQNQIRGGFKEFLEYPWSFLRLLVTGIKKQGLKIRCLKSKFQHCLLQNHGRRVQYSFAHPFHSLETHTDAGTAGFTGNEFLLLARMRPACLGLCLLRILTICPLAKLSTQSTLDYLAQVQYIPKLGLQTFWKLSINNTQIN